MKTVTHTQRVIHLGAGMLDACRLALWGQMRALHKQLPHWMLCHNIQEVPGASSPDRIAQELLACAWRGV